MYVAIELLQTSFLLMIGSRDLQVKSRLFLRFSYVTLAIEVISGISIYECALLPNYV